MTPKPRLPSARIAEIRERLIEEQVDRERAHAAQMGFPPDRFDADISRRGLVKKEAITLQAIIEYLDERDAEK